MATLHEWAEAYRQQALRDLAAAKLVQGAEPSLLAMLLQMTFEKLGKAALLRSQMLTIEAAQNSHLAATSMMGILKGNHRKSHVLGYKRPVMEHVLVPMVEQLESLNPSVVRRRGGQGPWLEYPWEGPNGAVCWPARDLPSLNDFRPRQGPKPILLIDLADALCENLNRIFG